MKPDSLHKASVLCPGGPRAVSCPSRLYGRSRSTRSEKASERLQRLPAKDLHRANGVEQLTRFSGWTLLERQPWLLHRGMRSVARVDLSW